MTGDVHNQVTLIGNMVGRAQLSGVFNNSTLTSGVSVGRTIINRIQGNRVFMDTTANWNAQVDYVPEAGDIIAYTDRSQAETDDGVIDIPGLKLGDGNAYLIDLPFIDAASTEQLMEHIGAPGCHVTAEDRTRWDNKLNFELDGEQLIFNRN